MMNLHCSGAHFFGVTRQATRSKLRGIRTEASES